MTKSNNLIHCNDCGCIFREKNIFIKEYQYNGICLCRKCAKELVKDIESWSDTECQKAT